MLDAPESGMASLVLRNSAQNAFEKFAVETWAFYQLRFAITAQSMGFRISTLGIQWDDYLVCIGTHFNVAETALAYSVGRVARGLANGGMTDQQRATLGSNDTEYRLRKFFSINREKVCTGFEIDRARDSLVCRGAARSRYMSALHVLGSAYVVLGIRRRMRVAA
ncbi:hypothetical protein BB8028_0009g00610 [Beauveria bassiana]|uniref:Uncharacterized protein n=1 Tax=Beauveria bassiana TaxID=176275 RepID=A0A2S7YPF6_BEABA|nr:hypothetical protein BB8028_0009g00610 [Beauveria bassiana]